MTHDPLGDPINILLLDDDQAASDFVDQVLDAASGVLNVKVSKVSALKEALDLVQSAPPEVVLASLSSRKTDIRELIPRIREVDAEVPIIAIGTAGFEELALEAVRLGAQDCLFMESLDRSRIVPTIQYAIERRRISSDLLRLHMKQISATIEAVTDGILILSADKTVIFANKAAEQMLWRSSKELVGRRVPVPMAPGKRMGHTIESPTGENIEVETMTTIVPWDAGGAGYCVTIHDVTEHMRIQKELKSAARLKDEFIAHMSHELRTPMNGIMGVTSLLYEQNLPEDLKGYVDIIRTSGTNMLDIINDLLDLSKIGAGRVELENSEFSLHSLLDETLGVFTEKVKAKRLLLSAVVGPSVPPMVVADHGRLRQIIANLVSNAVKFTDEGAVIVRADRHESGELVLQVCDTGIGISKENQKHLFQPFTQLSSDPKRNVEGTGLGLAISRKLAVLMGGDIQCESGPGEGSVFTLRIKTLASGDVGSDGVPELRGRRVVLSMCDEHMASLLAEVFSQAGASVQWDNHVVYEDKPDLVVIDRRGFQDRSEVLQFLRELRAGYRGAVLLLGREGLDRHQLAELRVSTLSLYPLKVGALLPFALDMLQSPFKGDFANVEKERQSRIIPNLSSFRAQKLRILVAEDNMINQKVAIAMLDQLGIECDAVSDGHEAVEAAAYYQYDGILMDCRMPVLDGYEAAARIRTLSDHYKEIPIIAVTANALKSERIMTDASHMDCHIAKPVTIEALSEVLHRYFGKTGRKRRKRKPVSDSKRPSLSGPEGDRFKESVLLSLIDVSEKLGNNLIGDVVDIFLSQSPEMIRHIRDAAVRNDISQVEGLAHKLKGSARNVGATKMAQACAKLECIDDPRLVSGSLPLIKDIEAEFQFAASYLKNRFLDAKLV